MLPNLQVLLPFYQLGNLQVLPFYQPGKSMLRSLVAPKGAGGYYTVLQYFILYHFLLYCIILHYIALFYTML